MANTLFFQAELECGANASLPLKADALAKTAQGFREDADILKLNAGVVVTVGADGAVKPAEAAKPAVGFVVLSAKGNDYENCSAYASGLLAVAVGGGIYRTNNVVENSIKAGDELYIGADGVITKTKGTNTEAIGIALSANSAADKTIRFKALI